MSQRRAKKLKIIVMDTYGEIIVKLDRILMILPHFSFPCPGRRRAASSTPPCTRGLPLKTPPPAADRRRPSGVHRHRRRKLRGRKSDVEFGRVLSELMTSGGAGRTKRWAGGTPPLRPNRCGGLRRLRRKRNSDWWFRPSRDQRRRRLKTVLRKLRR